MEEKLSSLTKKELIDIIINASKVIDNEDIIQKHIQSILSKKANEKNNNIHNSNKNDNNNSNCIKEKRQFDMSKYRQRHIALQIQYDGANYIGFASQSGENDNTIEKHLFEALIKLKLIENRSLCKYTRCGRTDKGVSALGQIISLYLRSNLPLINNDDNSNDDDSSPPKKRKTIDNNNINRIKELDYCGLLNKVLPEDIRVIGWNEVSEKFSARFSATYRKYRYFFIKRTLNIDAMREAAGYLIGNHDFRNFCKMDVVNVTNFVREIFEANIMPFMNNNDNNDEQSIWMLEIKGIAFLWHMVRCIMAILLLVGEGKEQPTIVKELLDIEKCPSKPSYDMALDHPLVLYQCGFENLHLDIPCSNLYSLTKHYESLWERHIIEASRAMNALDYINKIKLNMTSVQEFLDFMNDKMKKKKNSNDDNSNININNLNVNDDGTISWINVNRMLSHHYHEPYKQLMSRSKGHNYNDRKELLSEVKKEKLKKHEELHANKDPSFFQRMRLEGTV